MMMGTDTHECITVVILLVSVGLADAGRAAGGGDGINWDMALPIVISVIALACMCCCWCNRSLGDGEDGDCEDGDCKECRKKALEDTLLPPASCGGDTVPRSEWIAPEGWGSWSHRVTPGKE